MKRRTFLRLSGQAQSTDSFPVINGDLSPYTGVWSMRQATHLARRLMFGANLDDISYFERLGMQQSVNNLLRPERKPPQPINDYNTDEFTDPDVGFGASWINAPRNIEVEGARIWSLKCWWMGNMIEQGRHISEKMLLFWFNHIPIQFYDIFFGRWDYRYLETLRVHSLGNFRDMIRAVCIDHAMLHYLNGQYNSKEAPDENFARELQELFCIGKGPNAAYTEGDVQEAAKVLTGWRVNYQNDEIYFSGYDHDKSDKVFSSFYGNKVIEGKTGQSGAQELDELLDMIFENSECALFICRKIYRYFVHHNITAWTEENIIAPLAEVFRNNNYEITPVLRTLFSSQHFFDQLRMGALIKSPTDFIASLYRDFNTAIPGRTQRRDRYQHNSHLVYQSYLFDQNLGDPPNVAGYPAYYQVPNFDKAWINTNTLPRRANLTDWILWAGVSSDNFVAQLNILGTVAKIPEAEDPNALIDFILKWQYPTAVSDNFRRQLKAILLSGQSNDYYWTNAWYEYLDDPDDEMKRETVRNRLLSFFYTLLHQEEYQLS
ncbi:MAG: DUF1800 domain-containing protein [Bacteroidota bacterium]